MFSVQLLRAGELCLHAPFYHQMDQEIYSLASTIRVWIAYGKDKISFCERIFYNFCFGFFVFSALIFSLCFAVQPDGKSDEAGNKEKMLVHAIPFMILEMGLLVAQVRKIKL
jgi:hypothetical protein